MLTLVRLSVCVSVSDGEKGIGNQFKSNESREKSKMTYDWFVVCLHHGCPIDMFW